MVRRPLALLAALATLAAVALTGASPASATSDGTWDYYQLGVGGTYQTLVGDFGGSEADDIFWYAPGSEGDSLWMGRTGVRNGTYGFDKRSMTVNGAYVPIVGDFAGDDHEDIFWYGPGTVTDTLWISNGSGGFTSKAMRINGHFKPLRLRNYLAGADDIFWYDPASYVSYRWDFAADGSGAFTSMNYLTDAKGKPVAGDWNGDGQEDVFVLAPASDTAYYVFADGVTNGSRSYDIPEDYTPVVVYEVPRDGILWYGPGSMGDAFWRGSTSLRFKSVPLADLDLKGRVTTYPLNSAIVSSYWADNIVFYDDGTAADFYFMKGKDKDEERPIVGDFDDDGYYDILWYAARSAPDELWYLEPAEGGAAPSTVERALTVPER